jgi:hypothetical protein
VTWAGTASYPERSRPGADAPRTRCGRCGRVAEHEHALVAEGDFPFPRPTIIARCMGVSKRTVERRIEKLVKAGLLERLP